MSRMTTRIGPIVVSHMVLANGEEVNTIADTQDKDLYMVFEANSIDLAIRWSEEYVALRYPDWKDEPLIGSRVT